MTSRIVAKNKKGKRRSGARVGPVGQYAEDAWSLAKRTALGLNQIRKLINIETKIFDTQVTATVDYNGTIQALSNLAQGSDQFNRIGNSVRIQHMDFRASWQANDAATGTSVRVVIFRDLEQTGTAPTVGEILTTVGNTAAVCAHQERLYITRFSILFDETITVNTGGSNNGLMMFSSSHQGHISYLGTTNAAGSQGLGSVFILTISDRVTSLLPTINYEFRLLYTDD